MKTTIVTLVLFSSAVLLATPALVAYADEPTAAHVAVPGPTPVQTPIPVVPTLETVTSPTLVLSEVVVVGTPPKRQVREKKYECGGFRPLTMGDGNVKECEWR